MNNYMAVMDKNETAKGARKSKPQMSEIHLKHAENGGFIAEHHMEPADVYHKPEANVFGAHQGKEFLAHIAKHMKVKMEEPKESAAEVEESAPGAAS